MHLAVRRFFIGWNCAVLIGLLVPLILYAAAITFAEHQVGGSSYDQVRAMEAIDLDEDGDVDIVSVSDVLNDLTWWENNGSESFTERTIDGSIDGIYDVKVIDIDGDGDKDIAFSAANTPKTGWYENDGSENFTQRLLNASYQGTCVDAADVDGDTDIDIVSCKYGTSIIWWENDGSESFTEHTVSTGNTTPIDIKAIDLDEDGDMDVIATWQTGNKVLWFDNNGSESFTQRTIDSAITTPWFMDVGDVDDDGDYDVVAASITNDNFILYTNDGSESFTESIVGSLNDASGVWIGDVDGDGDQDIAGIGNASNTVLWFDNNGSESFTSRTVNASFEQGHRIQIIDIDGDGDQDVVTAGVTNNNDNVTWWENRGPTAPTVSSLSPLDNGYNVSTTANLVITFDQAVQGGTGAITIRKSSGSTVVETINANDTDLVSGSGTTQITINPSSALATNTGYYINIGANAFKGLNSPFYAGISNVTTWNFTTTDTIAPAVSTLSPSDDATGISQAANLVIRFHEIVQGGTGTIVIKKASDDSIIESIAGNNATYVSGSGTTQITINPASTLTAYESYYVIVHANAFRDRAGNYYSGISDSTTWNFTTADLTNPTLSSVTPTDNSTGVSNTVNLVLNFSEAVQGGTGTVVVKKGSDNSVFETVTANDTTYVSGSGTTQMTVNLSGALALNTAYYIIINKNAFQDAYGRDYAGFTTTTTWNFTTSSSDTTKPLIVSLSPADNAIGISNTANLVMMFDEAVQGGTGTVIIKKGSDDSIVETITGSNIAKVFGSGGMQITLNPEIVLDSNTAYYVIINKNAFQDARGNDYAGFTAATTWNFTTTDTIAPILSDTGATVTATGATITWTTDEAASSRVQFGPTTSYGTGGIFNLSPRVTNHTIILRGMFPCARYNYRIVSTDASGNTATGSNMILMTPGCTGSSTVQSQTGSLIPTAVTGSLRLGSTGLLLTVPPSATTGDATFQIKQIVASTVLATAGRPAGKQQAGAMFNLLAFSGATTKISSFSRSLTVSVTYSDEEITGVNESTLWMYRYDNTSWNALDDCTVDSNANTVTCTTTAFSDFSIFGDEENDGGTGGSTGGAVGGGTGGSGGGGGYRSTTINGIASAINAVSGTGSTVSNDVSLQPTQTMFKDVLRGDWFAPFIIGLKRLGIVEGYKNESGDNKKMYGPSQPVTYGEFAKMLLLLSKNAGSIVQQVGPDWADPYMVRTLALGLSYYSQPGITANHIITRSGVVHSILEAYGITVDALPVNIFSDLRNDHPAHQSILVAHSLGLINGDDGAPPVVRPDDPVNRAEVARLLWTVHERFAPSAVVVIPIQIEPQDHAAASDVRYVTEPLLALRADSRIDAVVRATLWKGQKVQLLGVAHEDWAFIRLENGKEGYVWRKHLTK